MQIFNALPVFLVLGAAYAGPALQRHESVDACLWREVARAKAGSPGQSDLTVCYKGWYEVTKPDSSHFGDVFMANCGDGDAVSCFWMKGPNVWKGHAGGPGHLAFFPNSKCAYDSGSVTITCT